MPLLKSLDHQIWPKLCLFITVKPFLVALFYGNSKPDSSNGLIEDALAEYNPLSTKSQILGGEGAMNLNDVMNVMILLHLS